MKRYLIAFFVLLSSVAISQDIANHSMPIGGGPGAVGWKTGGPCSAGQALVWAGAGVDPTCTSVSGSGSTPGGANGAIQYNNAGTFGGITVGTGLVNSGTALNCVDATGSVKGCVQTDGATISVAAGVISCRIGTASVKGCLQVDGTTITVAAGVISAAPQAASLSYPGGRLVATTVNCSFVSDPILLVDAVGTTALCYVSDMGTTVPVGGANLAIPTTQINLSAAHQPAGNVYDIWGVLSGGQFKGCIGGTAWATTTDTLATRLIVKSGAIYINSATITDCWNSTSNLGPFTAGNATYLGSIYTSGNGTIDWVLNPVQAVGGTANILSVYNAYNRRRVQAVEREGTSNWFYSVGTWRCTNNSCNNKITVLDGLGLSTREIQTLMTIDTGDNNVNGGTTSVCIDCSPPGTPGLALQANNQAGFDHTSQGQTLPGQGFHNGIGLHVYTMIEIGGGGTATEWFGNTFSGMFLSMEN